MIDWATLITTSVGVVLGAMLTIGTSWAQFSRERTAAIADRRIAKLERLYEVLTEVQMGYLKLHICASNLLFAEVSSNLDASKPIPIAEMEMLIGIYGPSLRNHGDQLLELGRAHGELFTRICDWRVQKKDNADRQSLWDECVKFDQKLRSAIASAQTAIAKLVLAAKC